MTEAMTDQERRLAVALLGLCGWHVGMVTTDGYVLGQNMDKADFAGDLPDLDSPANWGHWEAWCTNQGFTVEVIPTTLESGVRGWLVTLDGRSSGMHESRGGAMLAALCVGWGDLIGEAVPQPPSVLAWWKHEKEEGSDG